MQALNISVLKPQALLTLKLKFYEEISCSLDSLQGKNILYFVKILSPSCPIFHLKTPFSA